MCRKIEVIIRFYFYFSISQLQYLWYWDRNWPLWSSMQINYIGFDFDGQSTDFFSMRWELSIFSLPIFPKFDDIYIANAFPKFLFEIVHYGTRVTRMRTGLFMNNVFYHGAFVFRSILCGDNWITFLYDPYIFVYYLVDTLWQVC